MTSEVVTSETASVNADTARTFNSDRWLGVAFVAPIVIVMGLLVFGPVLVTLWDSLHRIDPMRPGTPFIGVQNYRNLMSDANVLHAWLNTMAYVAFAVILETVGGLAAAILLNKISWGRRWLLAAVVLPWALRQWSTRLYGCGFTTRAMVFSTASCSPLD